VVFRQRARKPILTILPRQPILPILMSLVNSKNGQAKNQQQSGKNARNDAKLVKMGNLADAVTAAGRREIR
jgi:hypothetical protein